MDVSPQADTPAHPRRDLGEPRVTLAMPVFDEEATVPELMRRCALVLDAVPGGPHEIVVVDDGSRDRTLELLKRAAASEPRLVVVPLSRNFGHQAAFSAALDHASGDVVLMMDGDLQDPPEMLPHFLERWRQGYDVVYARRWGRKEPWHLRLAYFTFYRLIARLSDIALPLDSGDFALLSRQVVDALRRSPEQNRYLRGLRTWVGFHQCGIDVERHARSAGESKYGTARLLRLAFDGIFAFSLVPLRLMAILGALAVLITSAYGAYAFVVRLVSGPSPPGFTALILAMV
ncbi:MAG: glycosyltransferase family 2 protein, partial [Holophagales bacterium]|nr:glycosyltransferase family 2 protein [Holophagales bacterium]